MRRASSLAKEPRDAVGSIGPPPPPHHPPPPHPLRSKKQSRQKNATAKLIEQLQAKLEKEQDHKKEKEKEKAKENTATTKAKKH